MAEKKLLDRARDLIRVKHYSIRTEQTYLHWMKQFILYHNKRHPADMGGPEVEAYLTHLAVDRNVAPSTQNVAMQAILFLYREVRGIHLTGINALRIKKDKRLPVVLTKAEVHRVLEQIKDAIFRLQAKLLYGTGMRLLECLRLRVKEIEFSQYLIIARDTKGNEDRVTLLPEQLEPILHQNLTHVKAIINRSIISIINLILRRALARSICPTR
jgi:site-specific recombinase XerD